MDNILDIISNINRKCLDIFGSQYSAHISNFTYSISTSVLSYTLNTSDPSVHAMPLALDHRPLR